MHLEMEIQMAGSRRSYITRTLYEILLGCSNQGEYDGQGM